MVVDEGMAAAGAQGRAAHVSNKERAAREGLIARAAGAGAGVGVAAAVMPRSSGAQRGTAAPTIGGGGGRGVGETKEQREIDEANRGVVSGMSAAQIAEAQAELMARLPPGALDMLRRRGREKEERRRGAGAGQGSRSEGVSGGAGSGGAGEEKQQQQEEMQVDGGSGGDSGGASLHSSQQPLSQHPPASGPPLPRQHDRPATWEQRVERIRSVRFAMDGRPVPADVAREAESALGVPAEAAMHFDQDSPQGMAVRDLAVRHVAERDWLRTGAQPGRAGYTVREAVALSRSHVPAQAAAGLALLSAVLARAAHTHTRRDESHSDGCGDGMVGGSLSSEVAGGGGETGQWGLEEEEEDWQAVWAYALSHESVWRGEAITATAPVHKPKAAASFLPKPLTASSSSPSSALASAPSLLLAFARAHHWRRNVACSELLLPAHADGKDGEDEEDEEEEEGGGTEGMGLGGVGMEGAGEGDKRTVGSDANVACRDVCAGLIRMGILPRLAYLLQPHSPLQHHTHLHLPAASPMIARHVASSELIHLTLHHLLLLPLPRPPSSAALSLASLPAVLAVLALWRVLARQGLTAHLFSDYSLFFSRFLDPPFPAATTAAGQEGAKAEGEGVWGGAEVCVGREAVLVLEALCCALPRLRGVVPVGDGDGDGECVEAEWQAGDKEAAAVAAVLHCLATVVTRAVPTTPLHAAAEPAEHRQQSGAHAREEAPIVRPPFIDAITSALLQSGLLPCVSPSTPTSSPHAPPALLPPASPTFHLLMAAARLPCDLGVATRLLSTRAAGRPLSPAAHRRCWGAGAGGAGALVWREGSTERGGPAPGHIAMVAALLALLQTQRCMQPEGLGVSGNESGERGVSARELVEVCFAVAGSAGPADAEPAAFILLHTLLSPCVLAFSPAVPPVPSSTGEKVQVETKGERGEGVEESGGGGGGVGVRVLLEALWFCRHSVHTALTGAGSAASKGKRGRRRERVGGRLAAVEEVEEDEEEEMEGVEQGGEVQQERGCKDGERRVRFEEEAGEGTAGGTVADITTTSTSTTTTASSVLGVESSSSGSFLLQGACVAAQPLLLQWHACSLPLPPAWLLIPLPAAAAMAATASATHTTAPSESALPAPLSPLHTLHGLLAFLTSLETNPSTAPHMARLPASLKLHHLSLLFLADPPLYLHPTLTRPIACLQDAYARQLASQHSVPDFPPHLFPPSLYESFLQTLADRFAAASFGHVLFARQLATLLHAHVAPPIRLAAWRALDAASVLHLLPPLALCPGSPMGYLYASPHFKEAGGSDALVVGQGQAVGGAGGPLLQACMQSLECGALDKCCSLLTSATSLTQPAHEPGATSQPDDPLLPLTPLSPHKAVPDYPLSLALAASLLVAFLFDHAPDSDCPTLVGVAASPQPDQPQPQASEPLAQSQTAIWQRESVARRLARYAQRTPVARELVAYLLTWQLPGWRDRWRGHDSGSPDGAAGGSEKGAGESEKGGGAQQEEEQDMGRSGWVVGKAVVLRRMALLHRALQAGGAAAEASKGVMAEEAAAAGAGDAALSALQAEAVRHSAQAHSATSSTVVLG
ncbi:unnamed protein product [Closterium sp. Yama58-4]|nr:unnamed protein product [Closterium sp. Yama58-4]